MNTKVIQTTSLLGFICTLTFLPVTALAQDNASASSLLDEVIVTALADGLGWSRPRSLTIVFASQVLLSLP